MNAFGLSIEDGEAECCCSSWITMEKVVGPSEASGSDQ